MNYAKSHYENQKSEASAASDWDALKDVPMARSELATPSDVLADMREFSVKDGKVYSKETGQEESNLDTVLRVKTSKLLFSEAKSLRDKQSRMLGERFTDRGPDYYVDEAMDRYGFNDENTEFAEGKMLKDLIDSGAYHQAFGNNDLSNSKYKIFTGAKADFGQALLRYRLRQHGRDLADFKLDFDASTFDQDGYSTVDIQIITEPLDQKSAAEPLADNFHHPAAEQLSQLEAGLKAAREEGDETAIKGYQAALKMAVERNRLEVSPEDFTKMSPSEKERFFKLKMKEEKILGDKEAFDFWRANLKSLQ